MRDSAIRPYLQCRLPDDGTDALQRPRDVIEMKQDALSRKNKVNPLVPTIFHEQWWLDITTDGQYGIVEVAKGGKTVGRLPYFLRSKYGVKYSFLPTMTHFLGPAIDEGDGSLRTRLLARLNITRELIAGLPKAGLYKYKCHRDVTDVVAFQDNNFETAVHFTFEIAPNPVNLLWSNFGPDKRSQIHRAQNFLTTTTIDDPDAFYLFYNSNIVRRGSRNYYRKDICCRAVAASLERASGRIYAAKDKYGSLAAAAFCVWDQTASYFLLTTRTPDAHNGAVSLVLWEAIKDAALRGLIIDFDALGNKESFAFFSGFGGVLCPRYVVTRASPLVRIPWVIKELFRAKTYYC
jgi:Acetyltransferase (GNAT) domain